ncbi:WhiB family transcriptional regulator [Embleya scabrispora]|uniref:WhiB family transcriptional regulator n=1 Tax=Embleya scabrispora TaxID=159449 RepID=UPI001F48FFB1|nr:WhiB family transcriptional regulator [Embleya scabrispora]
MTDWRHLAHCRNSDTHPELFFPDGETTTHHLAQIARAKAVCAQCPVQGPCGDWALARPSEAGIWGGLTENERRALKRRAARRRTAA